MITNNSLPEVIDSQPLPIPSLPDDQELAQAIVQVREITTHILDSVTVWKQIDLQMHAMDTQLTAFLANLDKDLEKYKASIPVVKENLAFFRDQTCKVLEKAIEMNPETELELRQQSQWIDLAGRLVDRLTDAMFKLL